MKIKSLQVITILCLCSPLIFAQWISLNKFSIPDSKPEVELISSDASCGIIKVDLSGYKLNELKTNGKIYHSIILGDNEGITTEVGMPEIPYISKVLAVPDRGTISVEILNVSTVQTLKGINIPPARESWMEGKPETPYTENKGFYQSGNIYPQNLVNVEDPVVFRDFRLARISIFPIRYSPLRKEIEAVKSITIRINYGPGLGVNPKLTPQRPIVPSFNKLYKSTIFNYDEIMQQRYSGRVEGHDIMLCIMPDMYIEEFEPYAEWKYKSGTDIVITKFSEIGANYSNPQPIKDYILNVYNSWENPPAYILIVGDYGTVNGCAPRKQVSLAGWTFANEDWFVELEGNDYFPEMMIGRFTNHGTGGEDRLKIMVNKFLSYEKYPSTTQNEWYKKATVCSNNAYQSQIATKRSTAHIMALYGGFTVDTMMSVYPYGCPYNLNDVKAAINSGRSLLNYRGEGWSYGWWASCYQFATSDVSTLTNYNKLTFVTSIGCGVAMFDDNEQCFGEEWIEMGTLTEPPRGACAFLGPTSNTHTAYNNQIDLGIYTGMFEEGLDSPGEALLRGKLYMFQHFGSSDPFVEYHYKIYCALGDPSLHVWLDIPKAVEIDYPEEIYVGFNQVQVTVKDSVTGIPVGNARICISGDGTYATGTTDYYGNAILDVTPSSYGYVSLNVAGRRVIPIEKTIEVLIGTENITLYGSPSVTDIDGNNDGLINPNENCSITFTLKNWGTIPANNVTAVLTYTDTLDAVTINTGSVNFGNITPGDSVTGDPFEFFVKPECPVGYVIPFRLHIESTDSSWEYRDEELVHGCKLEFSEFYVEEIGNSIHNLRMDPGDTVEVKLKIFNTGDDIAPDVTGTISTDDPYMTILDSTGTYGTILPDSNFINVSDTYIIAVSENCPSQYNAKFSLRLSTHNGLYPYNNIDSLTLPVSMPNATDPTGPDEYGYFAYSSNDIFWDQSPVYEWIDIETIGTEIPKPPPGDFYKVVQLPFNFKYYGNSFDQVTISSEGWIAFGSLTVPYTQPDNSPLPNVDGITNMTAVFWDDLFVNGGSGGGKLYYYTDNDNHRFIVEWDTVPHFTDPSDKETFEIILLDPAYYSSPTGDGEIIFQFKRVDEPGGCTIGLENQNEDIGLQYLFNELYDVTANEITNGTAIKFTTEQPTVVSVEDDKAKINLLPVKYSLEQNYPNPFNPYTRIRYSIPEAGEVIIKIYRINGELIKVLLDEFKQAGRYEFTWDGTNNFGDKVSSGVYFYRMLANDYVEVKKMILLK